MTELKIIVCALIILQMKILHAYAARIYGDPNYSFVRNATDAPLFSRNYDYIIVGGGTAGCPLAATLSQNFSVLLLERGGQPYPNPLVENLIGFYPDLQINTTTSASQPFVSEDGVPNQRARVLGGGSAINAGFFTYASSDFVADAGWDATLVNESYAWVADEVAQFPTLQVFQSAARDALLEAGVTPFNGATYQHLIGTKVGGSLFDNYGRRHTAADLLTYANPNNLNVYVWATALQLLFVPAIGQNGVLEPRAVGVVYMDLESNNHTAYLNENTGSEVILSAGALGSPQFLMLNGIGPLDHLAEHGIDIVLDNPSVGMRMADNPTNSLWILTNQEVEVSLIQVVGITAFGSYIEISSGTAQVLFGGLEQDGYGTYFQGRSSTLLARSSKIDNSNITAQALQARIFEAVLATPQPYRSQAAWSGTVLQKIWGPQSWGVLTLASLDVNENPRVRFNYFQEERDLDTCEQGIRMVMDTINAPALARLQYTNATVPRTLQPLKDVVESTWPQRDLANDTQDSINIRQWCVDSVVTIWHYHGGCLVGDVVDAEYRVLGVQSLRVIDGSTFQRSPGTNPQATVMMLGRYMGVQILRGRLGSEAGI